MLTKQARLARVRWADKQTKKRSTMDAYVRSLSPHKALPHVGNPAEGTLTILATGGTAWGQHSATHEKVAFQPTEVE
jgi:hypothetical protein